MFTREACIYMALSWASCLSFATADLVYHFTMGVTSPAPVPGQPFTFAWTGGEPDEAVYIVLNDYFPNTPDQNIIYGTTDILSDAPNNGSWTYNVPLNIQAGRHSFSIGYNPLQLSDQTEIFVIEVSQTSYIPPGPSTSNTAFQSYNGCGLPPLPDYTYTGYQHPCTVTTSGHITTLFPIVPASLSSLYSNPSDATPSTTQHATSAPTTAGGSLASLPLNTAFASGVFAQALQCPIAVTPSTTKLTARETTTVLSIVNCAATSAPGASGDGICHESGYSTFSVSETRSVCCPNGWATTPLNEDLWCFTSMTEGVNRAELDRRQVATTSLSGLVFTMAGAVTKDAGQSESTIISTETPTSTASGISPSTSKNAGLKSKLGIREGMVLAIGALYYIME